jgi:hypothetical protein
VTDVRGLLLTGVFGSGKTAVAAEVADVLEASGQPFAAIDLDWLCWSNAPGAAHGETAILVRNLGAVVAVYRAAGVRRFVLAGAVADAATLEAIRAAMAMPVAVVRLTAPLEVIDARLGNDPTRGRADDLARARLWLAAGTGAGLEDGAIENVGPLADTARRALQIAGWSAGTEKASPASADHG